MNKSKKIALIVAIFVIGGLGGIIGDKYLFPYLSSTYIFSKYEWLKKSTQDVTFINKTEQVYVKEETSIRKIADSASASVVNIISIADSSAKSAAKKPSVVEPATKNGTGLIATNDGLIVTHRAAIIENAKFKVLLSDDSIYDATLFGSDDFSDLVFLKIDTGNLPAASFGNSDDIKSGEKIIALSNNSQNYQNGLIMGIISRFENFYNLSGQLLSSSEKLEGVFRADFGDRVETTGSPIIDFSGKVIGLTGSLVRDGKTENFLIPINKVNAVIEKAIRKKFDETPKLGIYYLPLNKSVAVEKNLGIDHGAMIFSPSGQNGLAIIAGSPAEKAGLKIGDIVLSVSGEEISESAPLSDIIYRHKKGEKISLKISRGGKELEVPVEL